MIDLQLMVKFQALTERHNAKIRLYKGQLDHFGAKKFDPESYKKRVARISNTSRTIVLFVIAIVIVNGILATII